MNLVELDHALRKLRLSGIADVLEARLRQAQSEKQTPSISSPPSSGMSSSAARTGSSRAASSRPASATPSGRSTPLISISTRR